MRFLRFTRVFAFIFVFWRLNSMDGACVHEFLVWFVTHKIDWGPEINVFHIGFCLCRWLVQERADGRNVGNWHWYVALEIVPSCKHLLGVRGKALSPFLLTNICCLLFRTEKSLFPWAKQQMEETFADYTILEDDTKRVWFAGVDTFKVSIFPNFRVLGLG